MCSPGSQWRGSGWLKRILRGQARFGLRGLASYRYLVATVDTVATRSYVASTGTWPGTGIIPVQYLVGTPHTGISIPGTS